MDDKTYSGFQTSVGYSFGEILTPLVGEEGTSGQDIHSVLSDFSARSVTPDLLREIKMFGQQSALASAFNDYFSVSTITPIHIDAAIDVALKRWG